MGKKSRKSSKKSSGDKLASDLNKKLSITDPPPGASCWICLDDAEDDSGEPIRRDCSCRGNSGWVHLSCLIKYAETKSEEWIQKNGEIYYGTGMRAGGALETELGDTALFQLCPNCKKGYLNQFALDMVDGQVAFVKKRFPCDPSVVTTSDSTTFPCDPHKYIDVLVSKLVTCCSAAEQMNTSEVVAVGRAIVEEILALAAKMRACLDHSRIHESLPRITQKEACAYQSRAQLTLSLIADGKISKEDGAKEACRDYEKSIELSRSIGDVFSVANMEMQLKSTRRLGTKSGSYGKKNVRRECEQNIELLQERLKLAEQFGGFATHGIKTDLANSLLGAGRVIEAERLLDELYDTSRRANGENHPDTKGVEELGNIVKTKRVQFRNGNPETYMLVKYTDAGDKCVLRGPITFEKFGVGEGVTSTVKVSDVRFHPPVAVMCVGLKGAQHLNGQVGDAREYNPEKDRYTVVFEDPKLKSALVKYENLRVVFDLPEKK